MQLLPEERVIHEMRPDSRLVVAWLTAYCIPAIFASVMFGLPCLVLPVFAIFFNDDTSSTMVPLVVAIALECGLVLIVLISIIFYSVQLRKTYVYYVTDRRCVFCGGILRHRTRSVPYDKITDVEISRNIIERMLGLCSIRIFTPGTSSIGYRGAGGQQAEISFVGLVECDAAATEITRLVSSRK